MTTPSTPAPKGLSTTTKLLLVAAAIIIAAFPMFLLAGKGAEFAGTDSSAESVVEEENPTYTPWASPLVGELPGEVESGLFALQAALGAGLLGYVLGNFRGRNKAEERYAALAHQPEQQA